MIQRRMGRKGRTPLDNEEPDDSSSSSSSAGASDDDDDDDDDDDCHLPPLLSTRPLPTPRRKKQTKKRERPVVVLDEPEEQGAMNEENEENLSQPKTPVVMSEPPLPSDQPDAFFESEFLLGQRYSSQELFGAKAHGRCCYASHCDSARRKQPDASGKEADGRHEPLQQRRVHSVVL